MEIQAEIGDWVKEKTLGCGGFGCVILWKNKISGDQIAIKYCRFGNHDQLLSERQKERWKTEVEIMKKLSHANVVSSISVPDELNDPSLSLPAMAMEYCSHGDLRKVLKDPMNCCGLSEVQVRNVIENVASAVKYLHSMRIIHRDLKPENIVLQDVDGKTVYKLIDLGYAKNVEANSLCSSFVGTVQYLAPELFLSESYNSTVDYWSLGLVAHECITGIRPFLPKKPPAQWMPLVCKKKSNIICVYEKEDGEIVYSEKLFQENHLNKILLRDLEDWLKLMLEWRPEIRGTQMREGQKDIIAFSVLDKILAKKIVHAFYVGDGSSHFFEINSNITMKTLLSNIASELDVLEEKLEFLLPRGSPPNMESDAVYCSFGLDGDDDDDEWMLFVYPKNMDLSKKVEEPNNQLVIKMFEEKNSKMSYEEQHRMWCHSVYFLQKIAQQDKYFHEAQKILMKNILIHNSKMMKLTSEMNIKMKQLLAKWEFFLESLETDKTHYREQQNKQQLTSSKLEKSFKYEEMSKKIQDLHNPVNKIESQSHQNNTKTIELQRNLLQRNKQFSCSLNILIQQGCKNLENLRQKPKEERDKLADNHLMINLVQECLKKKQNCQKLCFSSMKDISKIKDEILKTKSSLESAIVSIDHFSTELLQLQKNRQLIIWKALSSVLALCNQKSNGQIEPPDSFGLNGPQSSLGSMPNSLLLSSMNSTGQISLSAILNKSSEESLIAIQENHDLITRFEDVISPGSLPEPEKFDWSFLNKFK